MQPILFALLLVPFALHAAEIYKTIDDEGNVTYSEQPPAGGNVEIIKTKPESGADQTESINDQEELLERTLEAMELEDRKSDTEQQLPTASNPETVTGDDGVVVGGPGVRHGNLEH